METSASSGKGTDKESSGAIASAAPLRDDDSGLHDLRSLAQSTKVRMSSRRITAQPTNKTDDDILASTSAGWKAVALPEPAQMVSLPALDQLPSKREVLAKERAVIAPAVTPKATAEGTRPVVKAKPKARSGNRAVIAVVGSGLAVAAGAVIFFATRQPATQDVASTTAAAQTPAAVAAAPAAGSGAAVHVEPIAPEPPTTGDTVAAGSGSATAGSDAAPTTEAAVVTPPPPPPTAHVTTDRGHAKVATGKAVTKGDKTPAAAPTGAAVAAPVPTKAPADGDKKPKDEIEDLLSQAGTDRPKPVEKLKPDNKSLSGADFKSGMAGVAARAQACYKGTQGTVSVKLTVAPSGKVSRAAVTGDFAGKPEGECVQNAVKGASFPPWDGGPQSFNYSYLLNE